MLLLNEMLNNAKPKEKFVEGDAYDVSLSFSLDFTIDAHVLKSNLTANRSEMSTRATQDSEMDWRECRE